MHTGQGGCRSFQLFTHESPAAEEDSCHGQVICTALLNAGLKCGGVTMLEMHGTGTTLGDPIEMSAAIAAICSGRETEAGPLTLGAVKSIVGHSEPAAGAAGLMAAIAR